MGRNISLPFFEGYGLLWFFQVTNLSHSKLHKKTFFPPNTEIIFSFSAYKKCKLFCMDMDWGFLHIQANSGGNTCFSVLNFIPKNIASPKCELVGRDFEFVVVVFLVLWECY